MRLQRNKGKIIPLLKCAVFVSKKTEFIKKQKASRLLNSSGLKKALSKISLLDNVLL